MIGFLSAKFAKTVTELSTEKVVPIVKQLEIEKEPEITLRPTIVIPTLKVKFQKSDSYKDSLPSVVGFLV
jgi:hypothetical protein